jgi:ribosomal protein S18 acetylase RimI-like enzyme
MRPELLSPDPQILTALPSAMNDAFSDYAVPMRLTDAQFAQMMKQRSLDPELSAVAMVDGEVAAFWLMGRRDDRVYLIVSGTRPAYRRRGMSKRLADHVFRLVRAGRAARITSEVISGNEGALALYRGLGFTITRTLDCYTVNPSASVHSALAVEPVDWRDIRALAPGFCDHPPSWQNENQAIDAVGSAARCIAVLIDALPAGFAAFLPENRTLCQLAVARGHRRKGLGTALLAAVHQETGGAVRLINVDARDRAFSAFLASRGAEKIVQQYEIAVQF